MSYANTAPSSARVEKTPGPIARYLTVGGATVDLTERSGYYALEQHTETYVECQGCKDSHIVEWGFDIMAHDYDRPQPDDFDKDGRWSLPRARKWAQAHAEKCRAMPVEG